MQCSETVNQALDTWEKSGFEAQSLHQKEGSLMIFGLICHIFPLSRSNTFVAYSHNILNNFLLLPKLTRIFLFQGGLTKPAALNANFSSTFFCYKFK